MSKHDRSSIQSVNGAVFYDIKTCLRLLGQSKHNALLHRYNINVAKEILTTFWYHL